MSLVMRKIYITLALLILGVAGMAYLYFSNLMKDSNNNDHALYTVVNSAPVIFTFENDKGFYDILSKQEVTTELLGTEKSQLLKTLKSAIVDNSGINNWIEGKKVILGFLPGQNNTVDFAIAVQLQNMDVNEASLKNLKAEIKKEGNYYELKFGDTATCYLSLKNQAIFISNSKQGITQINAAKNTESDFADYIKKNSRFAKNTLANIYVNYGQLPSLLKNILNSTLTGELSLFNKQNAYAALSYNFGSDKLLLNGYTEVNSETNFFKLFADQKEQKVSIDQCFPEQTANYTLFTIEDYEKWSKALKNLQKENKEEDKINKQHQEINEQYRIKIEQSFPVYFNKQLAVLQLKTGEKIGVVDIKNGDKLEQFLLDLSTEYAPEIRIFKEPHLLGNFFGEPFKKFERPFFTIIDNHFVVANYASTLQVFLNSYRGNKLLVSTNDYTYFKDQISSSATIAFYINRDNSSDIFSKNLRAPYYKQYQSKNGVKDYNAFGYQLSADNGKFLSNVLLLKNQTTNTIDSLKY
ncbi:hypothetical protein ACQKCH_07645 [Nubsella zeaxanthinifaciens]|uniref:hypothetical protein n=1 Tax=Nubsella zeaxanthinifaciens TaxID=392412 RepID=UPI003CFC809E